MSALPRVLIMHSDSRWSAANPPPIEGCRWCGTPDFRHGLRWCRSAGTHGWVEPTDAQRAKRRKARLERHREVMRSGWGYGRPREPGGVFGCRWCGVNRERHTTDRWVMSVGGHGWVRPTDRQVKARWRARRARRAERLPASRLP